MGASNKQKKYCGFESSDLSAIIYWRDIRVKEENNGSQSAGEGYIIWVGSLPCCTRTDMSKYNKHK